MIKGVNKVKKVYCHNEIKAQIQW